MSDSRILNIWIDMDGVLADFDAATIALIGQCLYSYPDSETGWAALGEHRLNIYQNLPKMPDADDLIEGVQSLINEFSSPNLRINQGILTAIPQKGRVPKAVNHKINWIFDRYPHLVREFNIGPFAIDKQTHCLPGDVLIDDSDLNVPQWAARGGKGILHRSAEESLAELRKYLSSI